MSLSEQEMELLTPWELAAEESKSRKKLAADTPRGK
jgi:hypothetical protein